MKIEVCGGGGQVVSVLAFNSDYPSSNPAESWKFSVISVLEKNENKQKEAGGSGPFKKIENWIPLKI